MQNDDNSEFVNSLLRKLSKLNYIKPGDVPNIDLYMDQVTTFMDEHLSDSKRYADDKILTKTMINNYTKNNLLPPPIKKKYSRDHIYVLAFIYYFKNLLSISDIQKLLSPITNDFFGDSKSPSIDAIYKEVYKMEKEQLSSLARDVYSKFNAADQAFTNVEDQDEQRFLQMFTFISLLSFDVYMKKNIIENMIDELAPKTTPPNKNTKDKKATEKKATEKKENTKKDIK